ncbi:hypothetical protein F1C10_14465 [Sphingomonas sp. NBWT7]|uniref:hypothetical protein n=1 Tax=Sphingomonas sp. NBWT7 TaxID=2596913 RepID=UPI0016289A36|nr:hypothetical protein [Sphingomonas sp. NBWT7]QNE33002.1 hypothetical protein F1C10_14465 [Sphingomonas sp. NBWT7]
MIRYATPTGLPTLCIAVDMLPASGIRPSTLGELVSRTQDLIFAAQSRRRIERWRRAYVYDP